MATTIELKENQSETVAYEIDCPRCYAIMSLCFEPESENPFYACDDCDFILHTISEKE